jgi:hypothetical protein
LFFEPPVSLCDLLETFVDLLARDLFSAYPSFSCACSDFVALSRYLHFSLPLCDDLLQAFDSPPILLIDVLTPSCLVLLDSRHHRLRASDLLVVALPHPSDRVLAFAMTFRNAPLELALLLLELRDLLGGHSQLTFFRLRQTGLLSLQ